MSGGRPTPFVGERYSTIACFDGWPKPWEEGQHWSVVIDFDNQRSSNREPSDGSIRFLAESAPHETLTPGARFELYEGRRCTAIGEVLWP
jgi:hypothetical protein